MSAPKYLIDTNVFIGLEDFGEVSPTFASFLRLTSKYGIGVFVHAAALDDVARDTDLTRRRISLSKLGKFQIVAKVRAFSPNKLQQKFGPLNRPNDVVDATLLHALELEVVDFLITEDRGLHERARRYAPALAGRVLYTADAVSLLQINYEPVNVPLRYVEEVEAHTIPFDDPIFDTLRDGYPNFDTWWHNKCVKPMRKCWVVVDDGRLAGIVVRKEESSFDTDARLIGNKILKVCTFKVHPERRGIKLGELLMKQILWFAQLNRYDVVYLTTYSDQVTLIDLLTYYGFGCTYSKTDGELVFEKQILRVSLLPQEGISLFDLARQSYPRFCSKLAVKAFTIPIQEEFHDVLFPELADQDQLTLFNGFPDTGPRTPGNTIRKVYICRAQARISQPGAILLFYKGKSIRRPSQAITTVGIFEDMTLARSTDELRRLAGGRSVYSDMQLRQYEATFKRPVKVINFLLAGHISRAVRLQVLQEEGIFIGHPPQSIASLPAAKLHFILSKAEFGFEV